MKKILLIEDDELIQNLYEIFFLDSNYEIKQVYNGKEGLDAILKFKPDIILLDLIMPVMNGETLLQKYYEDNNNSIKIPILISSSDQEKAKSLIKKYSNNIYYLSKTLEKKILLEKINSILK